MIIFNDKKLLKREDIDIFIEEAKNKAHRQDYYDLAVIFRSFLLECYEADQRAQEMISKRINPKYVFLLIFPCVENTPIDLFYYDLDIKDAKRLKKREEIVYDEICRTCFDDIKTFTDRALEYYGE